VTRIPRKSRRNALLYPEEGGGYWREERDRAVVLSFARFFYWLTFLIELPLPHPLKCNLCLLAYLYFDVANKALSAIAISFRRDYETEIEEDSKVEPKHFLTNDGSVSRTCSATTYSVLISNPCHLQHSTLAVQEDSVSGNLVSLDLSHPLGLLD